MPNPLTSDEITTALAARTGWSGDTASIHRDVEAPTFLAGVDLVRQVAAAAEEMNHHPDIDIRWRTVSFTLSTHSEGGVTQLDVDLAARIDDLAAAL